jgi:putative transposase
MSEVLSQCIEWRGKPKRIRSDNGMEFIAGKTQQFFTNKDIKHIPIQKGKPSQNGYIERFNRSYREGVLDAYILTDIQQAREYEEKHFDCSCNCFASNRIFCLWLSKGRQEKPVE